MIKREMGRTARGRAIRGLTGPATEVGGISIL